jgi:hypothetical protein
MKKLLHTILIVLMPAFQTGTAMAGASLILVIELLDLEKRAADWPAGNDIPGSSRQY